MSTSRSRRPARWSRAIEGAIDVGHLVRLMGLRQGQVSLAKLTLPPDDPMVGKRIRDLALPENTALVIVIRDGGVVLPKPDEVLQPDDEMLFFAGGAVEDQVRAIVHGATKPLLAADEFVAVATVTYTHDRSDLSLPAHCRRTRRASPTNSSTCATPCEKLSTRRAGRAHRRPLAGVRRRGAQGLRPADRHPARR